jgi:hypothetical protein
MADTMMGATAEPDAFNAQGGGFERPEKYKTDLTGLGQQKPPSKYDDDAFLMEFYKERRKECLDARWVFERGWWRNLLYVLGRQWIYYDRRKSQWLDKRMAKWMPRPVTNKCAEAVEAIQANFAAIKLSMIARPIGGDIKNVAAAEVTDKIQPYIYQEHAMDQVLRDMDYWLTVTGNAFLHPHWDKEAARGEIVIPYEECLTCGEVLSPSQLAGPMAMCPKCQGTEFSNDPIDPETGEPLGERSFVGKGRTDALSPFEIAVPPIYREFDDTPVVLHMAWRPKSYFQDRYPEAAKKLVFQKTPSERSIQLLRTLSTMNDMSAIPLSFSWGTSQDLEQDGHTEYRLWHKPTRDFPQGLRMTVLGEGDGAIILREDDTIKPGPLPYTTRDGRPIMPFIHVGYQPIGGRLWARSPLDLAIQKQDQINQLDCMTQLSLQRMGNPIWLEPKGSEVKHFTGEPGLVVRYNPMIGQNVKPERIPGEAISNSVFQLRQQYLDDFEQLCGTYDVLKGTKPAGVEAFSALQLLVERGQARLATVFSERGEGVRKWFAIALELAREFGPTRRVESILSPNGGWTQEYFETAQLDGDVEIVVEDGSQAPKTSLGRRAAIEQANQLRMIDPMDPEQRYTILQGFGLSDLVKTLDFDVKSALQEQDAFERWVASGAPQDPMVQQQLMMLVQEYQQSQMMAQQQQQQAAQIETATGIPPALPPPPPPPEPTPFVRKPYHADPVHFAEHRKWALSDKAREIFQADPLLEQLFILHLEIHQQEMQAQMMAMQGGGGGGAMAGSNRESGNPGDVPKGNKESNQNRGPE